MPQQLVAMDQAQTRRFYPGVSLKVVTFSGPAGWVGSTQEPYKLTDRNFRAERPAGCGSSVPATLFYCVVDARVAFNDWNGAQQALPETTSIVSEPRHLSQRP